MKLYTAASLVLTVAAAFLPAASARLANDIQAHHKDATEAYYNHCVSSDGEGQLHVDNCKQGEYNDEDCAKMLEEQCDKCLEEMNNLRYDTDKLEAKVKSKMDKKCPGLGRRGNKKCAKLTSFMETHRESMDKVKALEHEICRIAENPSVLTTGNNEKEPEIEESDDEDQEVAKLAALENVVYECGMVDLYKQEGEMKIEELNDVNELKIRESLQAVKDAEAECDHRQRGRRLVAGLGPSSSPSSLPSLDPSSEPSETASETPSSLPSLQPSGSPSGPSVRQVVDDVPSSSPSSLPSLDPSSEPSETASETPSSLPSLQPSGSPSGPRVRLVDDDVPSSSPSSLPSLDPSSEPSETASETPSSLPSLQPSGSPSESPQSSPSRRKKSKKPKRNPKGPKGPKGPKKKLEETEKNSEELQSSPSRRKKSKKLKRISKGPKKKQEETEKNSQEETEENSQEEDDAKIDFAPDLVSTTAIEPAVCQNMIDKQQEHNDLVDALQAKLKEMEDVWNENVAEQQLKCNDMCSGLHALGGNNSTHCHDRFRNIRRRGLL